MCKFNEKSSVALGNNYDLHPWKVFTKITFAISSMRQLDLVTPWRPNTRCGQLQFMFSDHIFLYVELISIHHHTQEQNRLQFK